MTEPTHRCLAGRACRRADVIDDERVGTLTEKPGTLCPACAEHIRSCIKQLPGDYAELRAALGERAASIGQKIRSTPTPAIPINTRREALMADIVETADRAAAIVSDALNTEQPTARRKPPADAPGGSLAHEMADLVEPHQGQLLDAAIAIVEPSVDLLAAAPEQTANVWRSPRRCPVHVEQIAAAEEDLAAELNMPDLDDATPKRIKSFLRERLKYGINERAAEKLQLLNRRYHDAGTCDDCGGWGPNGQARELVDMTGSAVALQLAALHNQARAELGKTRLRHKYEMPCPHCGGKIGRDDGTAICDCESCGRSWTERDYKQLAGIVSDERRNLEAHRFWLAEAYWRLDMLADAADIIRKNPDLDTDPRSGRTVLDIVDAVLGAGREPHQRAAARAISTNRDSAERRQVDEDNWTWRNEKPYQRPRRKRRKPPEPPKNPIHPASLLNVVDIDEDAATNGRLKCDDCNQIHAGDCA